MNKAIFPGSFDPFHEGHEYIVKVALSDFDLIYIIISWNENKKRKYSFEESFEKINKIYHNNKSIKVLINKNELTTNIAKKLNCFNIIRGIRNNEDLKYEQQLKKIYQLQEKKIKIYYYKANNKVKNISSSNLKNN